jgi:CRISPR-associated protein Cas2
LYEVKAVVVICVSAVADRFHGYLRSVMLNVHPGVFLSMDLDAGTRRRVFETVERWWNDEPCGSIVMIWKNTTEPLAVEIRNLGEPRRDVVEYDGILGIRRTLSEDGRLTFEKP